ncbi:hypothetical protein ACEUZ9_002019 [Paracoccus litorisediminis]|uniref:hypothetical protein n=1 Tax=Paracoccus litorisediminis TaxID=2006130 RepID=UPI003731CB11
MSLKPAYETTLRYGSHAVTLRASLRAAVALDQLPGGIPGAWDNLMRQSYSGIRQVILATATDRAAAFCLVSSLSCKPLASFVGEAQAACLDLLAALLKAGDDDAAEASSQGGASGKPMPLREYFTTLYQYATGWLGWPPSEVWNASPAEIEAAFLAHTDRLVKMTPGAISKVSGGSDQAQRQANIDAGLDPDFDRAGLQALKARQ